jgi:predicted nucleotidyltransferase
MNSLARLICSRVRAEIFRILFGVRAGELHLREIHRQTGFALGTVTQDLGKLVKLQLVSSRRDGNRVYYSANQRHPLYPEIRLLVLKTSGLVDVLSEALETGNIQCAFVFGSVASGTENADSDIDLMVIGDISLRKVSSLLSAAGNQLGREINPHVMSSAEFARRVHEKDHFVTSVLANPRIFVKGSAHDLEGMGS